MINDKTQNDGPWRDTGAEKVRFFAQRVRDARAELTAIIDTADAKNLNTEHMREAISSLHTEIEWLSEALTEADAALIGLYYGLNTSAAVIRESGDGVIAATLEKAAHNLRDTVGDWVRSSRA